MPQWIADNLERDPEFSPASFQAASDGNPPQKWWGSKVEFSRHRREDIPMKTSRFSDAQIIAILKQAQSGIPVPERCRRKLPRQVDRSKVELWVCWCRYSVGVAPSSASCGRLSL